MNGSNEFGYFSKHVATELDITTSTLRRWSIELEKNGYKFERNEKDQRIYYERDFKVFRELKMLLSNNVNMEDAIKSVLSRVQANKNDLQTHSVHEQELRLSVCDLEKITMEIYQKAKMEARQEFIEIIQQQQEYIDKRLAKLDERLENRDRKLMESIRSLQEQKQAELEASVMKEKEGFFARLFSKKK